MAPTPEYAIQQISLQLLLPHYSQEKGRAILRYLGDFLPYLSNFQPIVGGLREVPNILPGSPILYLTCPLLVQCRDGSKSIVVVNVHFLPSFPEKIPIVMFVMPAGAKVREDHAYVTPNGLIRVPQLPLLQHSISPPPHSLCEILLAITDVTEEKFPFVPLSFSNAAPSPAATPTMSAAAISPNVPSPLPTASKTEPPPPPPPLPPVRESVSRAAEALMMFLSKRVDAYLEQREVGLQHLARLEEQRKLLESRLPTVAHETSELRTVRTQTAKLCALVEKSAAAQREDSSDDLIQPSGDIHQAALELLSQIHGYDDMLALHDGPLRKGQVTCDGYIKDVSQTARAQFFAKYRYHKLLNAQNDGKRKVTQSATQPDAPPLAVVAAATPQPPPAVARNLPPAADPVRQLQAEFPQMDQGIVEDVWEATKSLEKARYELRCIIGS